MITKEITIQGKTYPVVFDMKTIINFEEITKKTFFGDKLEKLTDKIAIVVSSVLAADDKADLNVDALTSLDWDGIQEMMTAFAVVMKLSLDFFHIPEVIPENKIKGNGKKN